jgi:hypothetical protein
VGFLLQSILVVGQKILVFLRYSTVWQSPLAVKMIIVAVGAKRKQVRWSEQPQHHQEREQLSVVILTEPGSRSWVFA